MGDRVKLNETERQVLDSMQGSGYGDVWQRPLDIGRPTGVITRGLYGLVKKGLVERKNRRASTAYLYRLTQEGWDWKP